MTNIEIEVQHIFHFIFYSLYIPNIAIYIIIYLKIAHQLTRNKSLLALFNIFFI